MKKYSKAVVVIICALMLLFSFTAIFGFSSKNFGLEKQHLKGVRYFLDNLNTNNIVSMSLSNKEVLSVDDKTLVNYIIDTRLSQYNIAITDIDVTFKKNSINIHFPVSNIFTYTNVENFLANDLITLKSGDTIDGDTILEGNEFTSCEVYWVDEANGKNIGAYVLYLSLDISGDRGSDEKLDTAMRDLLDNGKNTISLWMNNVLIKSISFSEEPNDSTIVIVLDKEYTEVQAQEIADIINKKHFPQDLTLNNFIIKTSTEYSNDILNLEFGFVFVTLFVFSLILIVMFKLPGIISSIILTTNLSFLIALSTGYLRDVTGLNISIEGLFGMAISIFISFIIQIIINDRIKNELNMGRTIPDAIDSAFKTTKDFRRKITIIIALIGILLIIGFNTKYNFIWFLNDGSINNEMFFLGIILISGSLINHIFVSIFNSSMLKSISAFKAFDNKVLFGGGRNGQI